MAQFMIPFRDIKHPLFRFIQPTIVKVLNPCREIRLIGLLFYTVIHVVVDGQ